MDGIPDFFELTVSGDDLPFKIAKCASGYGARHDGWRTKEDQEFYSDMLPKLKPGCVILQINNEDLLFAEFDHIQKIIDPSEREDGTLPERPLVILMRAHVSKWGVVRKNLEFIATVLKERWGVGETNDEKDQFRLLCVDFLRCAKMGRVDQMILYLQQNPPPDLDFQDNVGATALHIAVANKDLEVTKLLLRKDADLFMADNNGLTALHVAVAQGSVELAEAILSKRVARTAGLLHEQESFGRTVVHLCAISGNVGVLKTLINMGGGEGDRELDLYLKDRQWGWEPIHYAAHYGHTPMVDELLKRGANIYSRTKNRVTVLTLAKEGGHTETVEYLVGKLKTMEMHRVMETDTETWLGSGTAELWVGNLSSTSEKNIAACDITVMISLLSDETRRERTDIEEWMFDEEDDDEDDDNEGNDTGTPVGEYDAYGLKTGNINTKSDVRWSTYYSADYDATFYVDPDGTLQWEEPWDAIPDGDENEEGEDNNEEDEEEDFNLENGEVEYYYYVVEDGDDVDAWRSVLKKLPKIATLVSKKLHQGEHVLIQCLSGTRASVAAVLGFMLTKRGLRDDPNRALPFFRLEETIELLVERIPNWDPGRTFLQGFHKLQDGLDEKRTKQAWKRMDNLYRAM